jgi:hypothetical protein
VDTHGSKSSVGVREFRDQATSMMGAGETLVIERHSEPIGFFVPIVAKDRRTGLDALVHLAEFLADLGARTGSPRSSSSRG